MTEDDLAAVSAADEVVTPAADVAAEIENADGQDAPAPAADAADEEKTRTQARREARKEADRRRAEEQAETARRLAEREASLARIRAAAAGVAEPKASDFTDPNDYLVAKLAHQSARVATEFREKEVAGEIDGIKRAQVEASRAAMLDKSRAFAEAIPEARQARPDFDAALAVASDPAIVSQALSEAILDSEAAHDLAYHLGKNPALARTLSAMNPVQQARELGRLEASLAAPKPQSRAPDPITPVKATATASKDPSRMTADEYDAWRRAGGTFKL